ncbi:MAG: polysaccharide deacetylase family protein [Planctomycetota bacterium]|nr:polysaccharide deacetylase family protein [Planctomycetota bacterium]
MRILLVVAGLLASARMAAAAEAPEPKQPPPQNEKVTLAAYLGDKDAGLSFTIDDGFAGATEEFVKVIEPTGFKVTWFINPGTIDGPVKNRTPWARWRERFAAGDEIGNHGMTHALMTEMKLKDEQAHKDADGKPTYKLLDEEINGACDLIKKEIGKPPFSYAAANGLVDDEIKKMIAARHPAFASSRRLYGGDAWSLAKANAWLDGTIKKKDWMVAMLHSYTKGYAAFKQPADFDAHLAYVTSKAGEVWVAPFGTIAKYRLLREGTQVVVKPVEHGVEIALATKLDTGVYDQPLTLVIHEPGVKEAKAVREGAEKPLPVLVRKDAVLVDALPGPGKITVTWSK